LSDRRRPVPGLALGLLLVVTFLCCLPAVDAPFTYDEHAGIEDTSELMFLDREQKWIRRDKLARGDAKSGVDGDPRLASAELGKMFLDIKINNAVAQIRSLVGKP